MESNISAVCVLFAKITNTGITVICWKKYAEKCITITFIYTS